MTEQEQAPPEVEYVALMARVVITKDQAVELKPKFDKAIAVFMFDNKLGEFTDLGYIEPPKED